MLCKGGGHYPECGRPQEGGCKPMDMCGHGGGGGKKSRKNCGRPLWMSPKGVVCATDYLFFFRKGRWWVFSKPHLYIYLSLSISAFFQIFVLNPSRFPFVVGENMTSFKTLKQISRKCTSTTSVEPPWNSTNNPLLGVLTYFFGYEPSLLFCHFVFLLTSKIFK